VPGGAAPVGAGPAGLAAPSAGCYVPAGLPGTRWQDRAPV